MTTAHLLPDSRTREVRGVVRSPHGNLVQIFCANCGKPWGQVPEKMITFAFALCDACAEAYGDIAYTYKEPDEVFWARAAEVMAEEEIMSTEDLVLKVENPSVSLASLIRDWQSYVSKFT